MNVSTYSVYVTLDAQQNPVLLGDADRAGSGWQVVVGRAGAALIDITAISGLAFDAAAPLEWAGAAPPACCGWSVVCPAEGDPVREIALNDANGHAEQLGCFLRLVGQDQTPLTIPLTIVNRVG